MPAKKKQRKRRKTRTARRRRDMVYVGVDQNGKGIFKKIGKAFKKAGKSTAKFVKKEGPGIARFAKKHKVISRGLSGIGGLTGRPSLIAAGGLVRQAGFGPCQCGTGSSNVRYAKPAKVGAKGGMAF